MAGLEQQHWDGMVRGALGGVAGLLAMGLFFRFAGALADGNGEAGDEEAGAEETGPLERSDALDDISLAGQQSKEGEPATAALGRIAYQTVLGGRPDDETRGRLGQAVHWSYGVLAGGVYGALRTELDASDVAAGLGYGAALWVLGDEVMIPLLGLSAGPTAHSISDHALALGAHLVYGATTAGATRALTELI